MAIISGFGQLTIDGQDAGRVEYKISVSQRGSVRRADGHIWGDPGALRQAFEARAAKLRREDCGFEMDFSVSSFTPGEAARIAVNGSPGPV